MNSRLTNILLTTILVIGGALLVIQMEKLKKAKENVPAPVVETTKVATALDTIFSRKSVREYTNAPVEKEKLLTLVKAGMAAPTARNLQPWSFIIIDNPKLLRPHAEVWGLNMLKQAMAAIIVCGKKDELFWQQDCSAATENILLAAEYLGLGAVWCAGFPREDRVEIFTKNFNIPEDYLPLSLVAIGYPAGETPVKDKYKEEKIHWNRW